MPRQTSYSVLYTEGTIKCPLKTDKMRTTVRPMLYGWYFAYDIMHAIKFTNRLSLILLYLCVLYNKRGFVVWFLVVCKVIASL